MKSTDRNPLACELWNERQAHFAMMQTEEQRRKNHVADRNAVTRFEESERKKRVNEIFWHGVMRFITHMTLAIIVVYTLFHFI